MRLPARARRIAAACALVLLSACTDDPTHDHSVAASPLNLVIEVGGLSYQREVVDPSSPYNPWMKNIGRLNGDDLPDLIVAGDGGPAQWYQAPNWTRRTIASNVSSESGSDVGDIDGDGDIDVVIGKVWYENQNGGSSWAPHTLPSASAQTHDIVIADMNGDGKLDIGMRGQNATVISIYLQNSPTSWTPFNVEPGQGLNGLDLADLNGDGRRDIVLGGVWLENPGGNVATGTWTRHTFASWSQYASVKVIDMDGDGRNDVVLSVSEEVGDLAWFKAPADPENGSWTRTTVATGLNKVHCFAVVDINHDGQLDIAASEFDGSGRLIVYLRSGSGWTANELGRDKLHNMRAADIDNDGDIDLFGVYCFGVNPVILYRNVEDGGAPPTSAPPTVAQGASANPSVITGTTTTVSVLGADDQGEGGLSYTWAVSGSAPGPVSFSPNGGNSAKTSTASFTQAGSYTLAVTIRDPDGQAVVSSTAVTVSGGGGGAAGTMGETTVLGGDDGGNGNLLVAQQATLAQGGTLQSLSFYVTTAAGKLRLGVYRASGSAPGTKVAETAEFTPVTGWNSVAVTSPATLTPGTYWLAYLASSNSLRFRNASSGSGKWYGYTYGTLPTTFSSSASGGNYHWSFYATLGVPDTSGSGGGGSGNAPPAVASAASASPGTVTGSTTAVSVLGSDDQGESGLRYTWAAASGAPATVGFSPNGGNSAKSSTATFTRAGSYTLEATITDGAGASVKSSVTVNVTQSLRAIDVSPASVTLAAGGSQQFSVTGRDQFSQSMTVATVTWSTGGGGSIGTGGMYTAGSTTGGPWTVTAASGSTSGTASVSVSGGGGTPSTFGETAVLSTIDGGNGGLLVAQQSTLAQARTLTSLSFYVQTAAGKLRLGVYRADGTAGGPGTRVAESAEFTPVSGWNSSPVTAVALPAGTYWLAYLSNSNSLGFRMATNGAGRWKAVTYGALPATFPSNPGSGAYHWSFYGTAQ